MKYQKIILPAILASSSLFVIFGFKKDFLNQKSQSSSTTNQDSLQQQDEINSEINYQKLSILSNRCRGCGKCAQIDPQHFEILGRIATVISSTNLDSSRLALAINNCRDGAIVLK
jgi:ferredoxin